MTSPEYCEKIPAKILRSAAEIHIYCDIFFLSPFDFYSSRRKNPMTFFSKKPSNIACTTTTASVAFEHTET